MVKSNCTLLIPYVEISFLHFFHCTCGVVGCYVRCPWVGQMRTAPTFLSSVWGVESAAIQSSSTPTSASPLPEQVSVPMWGFQNSVVIDSGTVRRVFCIDGTQSVQPPTTCQYLKNRNIGFGFRQKKWQRSRDVSSNFLKVNTKLKKGYNLIILQQLK